VTLLCGLRVRCAWYRCAKHQRSCESQLDIDHTGHGDTSACALTSAQSGSSGSTGSTGASQDVGELEAKLEHVRRARALTDASPLEGAFAFDYSVYALNEQYLHIRTTLLTVLAFALVAAAVVMLPLIVHPFTELLVLCIIVVTEVELYAPPRFPPSSCFRTTTHHLPSQHQSVRFSKAVDICAWSLPRLRARRIPRVIRFISSRRISSDKMDDGERSAGLGWCTGSTCA
jgi:hypothetical protein